MARTQLTGQNIGDNSVELGIDTYGTLPIAEGGTNAITAAAARTSLGTHAKSYFVVGSSDADYITDGTADNVEIQQAIAAADSAGGGTVYIKKGTYPLAASITIPSSDIALVGAGWSTILSLNNAVNDYVIKFAPSVSEFIKGVLIKDLKLACNGANQTTGGGGIYGHGAIWCVFERLWVYQPYHNGIFLYNDNNGSFGHHNVITNCSFEKGQDSASGDGRAILMDESDENVVSNCMFQENGRSGATEANHIYDKAGLNTFSNNQFVTGQTGLKLQGQHSKAVGNTFDGCQNHLMRINGNKNTVLGNMFYNIGFGGTANSVDGLWIDNVSYNTVCDNLFIPLNNTTYCRSGINQQANAGVTNNIITNNVFTTDSVGTATFATSPIIVGTGAGHIIKNNIGYNNTVSKTAAYTATTSDELIAANATGGAFTITLPTAIGNKDKVFTIKKTDSSGNGVTIGTTSSQTIDGATTISLSAQYYSHTVVSDGANWQAVSKIGAVGGGSGDVTAASNFPADNAMIRADGSGKGVQGSLVEMDDSGNMTFPTDTGVFFKDAADVYVKYVGVGEDALIIGNSNAGSGRIKLSYTHSVNWDLYGTGQVFYMDSSGSVVFNEVGNAANHRIESDTDINMFFIDGTNNKLGIGNAAPDEKLHVTGNIKVSGTGLFGGDVTVPDEAYGAGWDASLEVPTKNAVYDKIQTLSGGITWSEVTGTSQTAAVDNGYITNNAGLVTVTLPDTAAVGKIVQVVGAGAGGWKIAQNASEVIHFGNLDTTTGTGGYISSSHRRDVVELICVVANTEWNVINSQGSITIV